MKFNNFSFVTFCAFFFISASGFAQTLYVPSGSSGIGNSTNLNIGVGFNYPQRKFQVMDELNMKTALGTVGGEPSLILSRWTGSGNAYESVVLHSLYNGLGTFGLSIGTTQGAHVDEDLSQLVNRMYVSQAGRVGIGTITPHGKLHVPDGEAIIGGSPSFNPSHLNSSLTVFSKDNNFSTYSFYVGQPTGSDLFWCGETVMLPLKRI